MKKLIVLFIISLVGVGSVMAVNYPTYKPSKMAPSEMPYQAAVGNASVESLSPMLNADGTAVYPFGDNPSSSRPAGITSGPRRVSDDDDMPDGPAGDAVPIGSGWVLLLFAALFAARKWKGRGFQAI